MIWSYEEDWGKKLSSHIFWNEWVSHFHFHFNWWVFKNIDHFVSSHVEFRPNIILQIGRRQCCLYFSNGIIQNHIFRWSLPKAMSISRSEIFRKKEKDQKMKKVMEDHRSSMGIQWKVMGGPWFFLEEIRFMNSNLWILICEFWFVNSDLWILICEFEILNSDLWFLKPNF